MIKQLFGYEANPEGTEAVLRELPRPVFGAAAPETLALYAAEKEDTFLYPALLSVWPDFKRLAQPIGSCVGWGYALGANVVAAVDIVVKKDLEGFCGRILEAATYGFSRVEARGLKTASWSDGSYGAAAAKGLTKYGTLHYKKYNDKFDFTTFNKAVYNGKVVDHETLEKNFGYYGVPDELEPEAAKHRILTTSLVTSFDEAAAAIAISKNPVVVCSGVGFQNSKRDKDGFCLASGSWAHCMMFIAARFGKRPGLLCVNSWGKSNSGPTYPENMPASIADCSFWVDADTVDRMLRGRDTFALSSYEGFPPQKLPDFGFQTW